MKKITATFLLLFVIVGCATQPHNIQATHISSDRYQNYTCTQVETELNHVNQRVSDVSDQQRKKANDDELWVMISVFFWPALLFLSFGNDHKWEIANLKGQSKTLYTIREEKKCMELM